MDFDTVAIAAARGASLAHGVRSGDKRYKKGRVLTQADLDEIAAAGIGTVTVARLAKGDVAEDLAATRVAGRCVGKGVRAGAAFTGRVNLYAESDGLALIDGAAIDAVNAIDEAVTIATVAPFSRVSKGQMLATIKIIPFAASVTTVEGAERLLAECGAPVGLQEFAPHRAALISTILPATKPSLLVKNRSAIEDRLTALGSSVVLVRCVAHETAALAAALKEAASAGADPILVLGASAIAD